MTIKCTEQYNIECLACGIVPLNLIRSGAFFMCPECFNREFGEGITHIEPTSVLGGAYYTWLEIYKNQLQEVITLERVLEKIEIRQGDITELQVDAIVNAANSSLLGGGGVDGAIHRAAGPGLLEECRKVGGCPTGEARITYGYNLFARNVIHTVGPVYKGVPQDKYQLEQCYINSLHAAVGHEIKSIAFPAISCGIYGYPIKEASQIAIETVSYFLDEHWSINRVIFILFSEEDKKVYEEVINANKIQGD